MCPENYIHIKKQWALHRWQFLHSSERRFSMFTFHTWFLKEASVSDLLVQGNDEQEKTLWLRGSAIFLGKMGLRLNQTVFSGQSLMFKTKSTEASGQITVRVLKKRKKVEEIIIIIKNSITYAPVLRKIKLRPKHTFIEFFITEVWTQF